MKNNNIASIDIGTNTILMVMASLNNNGEYKIIRDENSIARLGEGFGFTKRITPQAIERAKVILTEYKKLCDEYSVSQISIAGTSALREAENRNEVCREFESVIGFPIEVISGEEEARLSFLGAEDNIGEAIVIDIGGGSTEIIHGIEDNKVIYRYSIPIGAVKLTEKYFRTLPPDKQSLEGIINHINEVLESINIHNKSIPVYTVAGTPTTIAAVSLGLKGFDKEKIHKYVITSDILNSVYNIFINSSYTDLIEKYNIAPMRADVISAGTIILKLVLNRLGSDSCIVSVCGLRYGILKALINRLLKK